METEQRAFVLRISPREVDRVPEALEKKRLIIGWSAAQGLLEPQLDTTQFRQIIKDTYYATDTTFNRSGADAGTMWRFIREMKPGDFVVVPHGSNFYVGIVDGDAYFDKSKVPEDTAYRRPVKWINADRPIPRNEARAALVSRMKAYQACVSASDLLPEIQAAIDELTTEKPKTFADDLQQRLRKETLSEIRSGRMDDFGFERLIRSILLAFGAREARIIPRRNDKGADIVATFLIANTSEFVLAVQAKHYQPKPPVPSTVIDDLLRGMEAESADLGWVVTSGTFSKEAIEYARTLSNDKGLTIDLVDGEQLAMLLLEAGFKGIN